MFVDYRKLNAVTRKNKYPVPPMNQLLTVFNGSFIFSKIDLCGAYILPRIKEGDVRKSMYHMSTNVRAFLRCSE